MAEDKNRFVTTVAILTRRLREGKTYGDFRRAWYHTTGFGVEGNENEGSNRMFTLVNIFDPREIIVLGFGTSTIEQLEKALAIDVAYRGENPLDAVIEPEIGRKFCVLISEDDFSAAGNIPYKPPSVAGKETDMDEISGTLKILAGLYEDAAKKRNAINAARNG